MANIFPTIAKPYYIYEEESEDPGISSDVEDGPAISRARFTKSRFTFTLKWKGMSIADKTALSTFYRVTVKGCAASFSWTHSDPNSEFYNTVYTVRFKPDNPLKFEKVSNTKWSTEIVLKEA